MTEESCGSQESSAAAAGKIAIVSLDAASAEKVAGFPRFISRV